MVSNHTIDKFHNNIHGALVLVLFVLQRTVWHMNMAAYQPVVVLLPLVQKPVLSLDLASHGRDVHEIGEKHHFIQSVATTKR